MLIKPAEREYRTWILDSRRWANYQPRQGDIVVASHPKCGTTWMQRIVDLLVFQSADARPVTKTSPWIDRRFPTPIDEVLADIEAQTHRRSLKTHLPADGLPLFDEVSYIHVGRDGRDVCLSYHHHLSGFTPAVLDLMDRMGVEDEEISRPYPRIASDPAQFFRTWMTKGAVPGHSEGEPFVSFFEFERTWWEQRSRENVLLVHYNDLKSDLASEMRRISDFLRIEVAPAVWPTLVQAAQFEAMKRDGRELMGGVAGMFQGGSDHFFNQGTNDRWRSVLSHADSDAYEAKLESSLPPACAEWVMHGGSTDAKAHS